LGLHKRLSVAAAKAIDDAKKSKPAGLLKKIFQIKKKEKK